MKLFSSPFRAIVPGFLAALILAFAFAGTAGAVVPEKTKVVLAVGGKTTLYYLPPTLAGRLGCFRDEGLDVEINDFSGGSRALQALTNAIVHALLWLQHSTTEDVLNTVPPEYLLGDKVLLAHNPAVRRVPVVWINQTCTNAFVEKALQKYKQE